MTQSQTNRAVGLGFCKPWLVLLVAALWLAGCSTPAPVSGDVGAFARHPVPQVVGPDYRIGVPDRVAVRCEQFSDFEVADAAVSAAGTVLVPLVGPVQVAGLTVDEASDLLTRQAEALLPGAEVRLEVTRYASRHVYAFGALSSVGPVAWRPGLRLVDVLNETAPTVDAATARVDVIRPAQDDAGVRRVTVDADRLLASGDAGVNVVLKPGDVVHVPRRSGAALAWSPLVALPTRTPMVEATEAKDAAEIKATAAEARSAELLAKIEKIQGDLDRVLASQDEASARMASALEGLRASTAPVETVVEPGLAGVESEFGDASSEQLAAREVLWLGVPSSAMGWLDASAVPVVVPRAAPESEQIVERLEHVSETAEGSAYFGVNRGAGEAMAEVNTGGVVFWD